MPAPDAPLHTFLCTDIEGSTALWESAPDAMRAAVADHERIIESIVASHSGRLFKKLGDGTLSVFPSAASAARAAIELQQSIARAEWHGIATLGVRAALHLGEAQERDGDYLGQAVNRVARVCEAAHARQILLTSAVTRALEAGSNHNLRTRRLGAFTFKGLTSPETIAQLIAADLPADFPPPRATPVINTNLPKPLTSFIGREREVADITSLLDTAPILTLVGPGGAGKTRLATHLAAQLAPHYPDGIWLVELAAITDPNLINPAIARTLAIREEPGRDLLETICVASADRAFLLLLDNCEHLAAPCALIASTIARACPHLSILCTSRMPLGVMAEQIYRVPSLDITTNEDTPADIPSAARLFEHRARLARPGFTLTPETTQQVLRICRHLDAMPLAIELAAAQLRATGLAQLEERISTSAARLSTNDPLVPARHRTVAASLEWSCRDLSDTHRHLLARLSVFSGGCDPRAAAAICADLDITTAEIPELLSALVDRSLVMFTDGPSSTRYKLLDVVRAHAQSALDPGAALPRATLMDRHAAYFLAVAEEAAPIYESASRAGVSEKLAADHDNLRAAIIHLAGNDNPRDLLRITVALSRYWYERGYLTEGRKWLALAIEQNDHTRDALLGRALNAHGNFARAQGDLPAAQSSFESSLTIWQALGDNLRTASLFNNLGSLAQARGDATFAINCLTAAADIESTLGDAEALARTHVSLGRALAATGRHDEAESLLSAAASTFESRANFTSLSAALREHARILLSRADFTRAAELARRSLDVLSTWDDPVNAARSLETLAAAARRLDRHHESAVALGASEALRDHCAAPRSAAENAECQDCASTLAKSLTTEDLRAALNEGRRLTRAASPAGAMRDGKLLALHN